MLLGLEDLRIHLRRMPIELYSVFIISPLNNYMQSCELHRVLHTLKQNTYYIITLCILHANNKSLSH